MKVHFLRTRSYRIQTSQTRTTHDVFVEQISVEQRKVAKVVFADTENLIEDINITIIKRK